MDRIAGLIHDCLAGGKAITGECRRLREEFSTVAYGYSLEDLGPFFRVLQRGVRAIAAAVVASRTTGLGHGAQVVQQGGIAQKLHVRLRHPQRIRQFSRRPAHPLGMSLAATRRMIVGTGVLVAFPRSPMTVAVASWDLQKMSGGRFELGLGTQIRQNIEQRYSARWDSPVPQLREYVQSLKSIFHSFQTGAKLDFRGEHYTFTRLQPFFNPGPIDHPEIPILCGAVGPDMTRMVGRIADGMITHPTNTPPEYIRQVCRARLQGGFEQAGRDGEDLRLVLGPLTRPDAAHCR